MSQKVDILDSKEPLPCPICSKLFRLPQGFQESSAVACPHCEKQVTGAQLVESQIPTAKILDNSAPQVNEAAAGQEVKTAGRTRSFDEQDFVIPKPLKTATRSSRSRHPQRKSKSTKREMEKSNPLVEIMKIGFGAVLALPIAQLILWWGFSSDPLSIAPGVAHYAEFLVPPKLQPEREKEAEEEARNKDAPPSQRIHDEKGIPIGIVPDQE